MTHLKKISKYLLKISLLLLGLVLVYFLAAFSLAKITVGTYDASKNDVLIYIKSNGVHTDIVVPIKNDIKDWSKYIKYSHTTAKDSSVKYIGIGWGDKGFYLETPTWADLKFSTAFNAAFALGSTAIHTTFYHSMRQNAYCRKISISQEQYLLLTNYIEQSFAKNEKGQIQHIITTANYNEYDAFYEAKGRYSILHTCNTWANNGLKNAQLKACLWTPFDTGIFEKYPLNEN